ncbi:unnamed protein product [Ilex paraguariensis]|uniref:Uncharacterized protein n=1 Tax=Ilex paraguariensis TaxID=185542 RepID=A0ABC8U5B4_9AQUA
MKVVKLKTTSGKDAMVKLDSGHRDTQDVMEREVHEQPVKMGVTDIVDASFDNAGDAETEVTGISSEKRFGSTFVDDADDLQLQQLQDELSDDLVDSGDDATPFPSQNVVLRRKLRMVIEAEDEE